MINPFNLRAGAGELSDLPLIAHAHHGPPELFGGFPGQRRAPHPDLHGTTVRVPRIIEWAQNRHRLLVREPQFEVYPHLMKQRGQGVVQVEAVNKWGQVNYRWLCDSGPGQNTTRHRIKRGTRSPGGSLLLLEHLN